MPAPEPTWAQKAQNCKAELEGCNDQLERFKGIEQMLREANERIREMEQTSPDVSGLTKQIEFWKREAQTTQQREASLQGRVQQLENALRQAPTRELVETISIQLGEAKQERAQAAQQAAECTRKAAGMVQRLQQSQAGTEALRAMEQAADQWQRKATALGRELNQARVDQSRLAEVERDLAQVTEKYRLASEHIQRVEARLVEVMPAARALPTARADLVQVNAELDKVRRELHQVTRQRDQSQIDREELATLQRSTAHQTQRLFEAAVELERKQRELAASDAEVRRLRLKLNDARTQLG